MSEIDVREDVAVSVIVPVYNVESRLCMSLDSILSQNFQSIEIICIEDCSTDASLMILNSYKNKYPCIRVIQNSINRGPAYARNRGIELACGEYILFVDSDDMLLPGAISVLYHFAKEKRAEIVAHGHQEVFEAGMGKEPRNFQYDNFPIDYIGSGKEFFCLAVRSNTYTEAVWPYFFRRDFLISHQLDFYEGLMHEDILYMFKALMVAQRVAVCKKITYMYFKRSFTQSTTYTPHKAYSIFLCMIEIARLWHQCLCPKEVHQAIERYERKLLFLWLRNKKKTGEEKVFSIGTPSDRFLYDILCQVDVKVAPHIDLSEQMIAEIREASRVYIYGAGMYGEEMLGILETMDIEVQAVCVKDPSTNPKEIHGVSIVQVKKVDFRGGDLMILAVSPSILAQVSEELEETDCPRCIVPYQYVSF